jgi:ribose transport system ATP-binding protein
MSLLELRGIRKSFFGTAALSGVSFDLHAGEVHALVGANGAGKSTLIKILAGAYTRDEGEILLDDRLVSIRTPQDALALGIGVIYQEFNLVPEQSVAENVLLGAEPRHPRLPLLDRRRLFAEAARHLQELDFPLDPRRPIKALTTGEKQLVEIAKALHRQARVLVLDEPTAALSRREAERLFAIMARLKQRGLGMIYISHHLEEVFQVSDRITALRDGRNVATWDRGAVTEADLVASMVGRQVEAEERPEIPRRDVVVEAAGLTGQGFEEVSLRVEGGEILCLTGSAGAGQTELLWTLYGALPTVSGSLRLRGTPVRWRSLQDALRGGVAMAPGDRKAFGIIPGQSVLTNFTFPFLRRWTRGGILDRARQREAAADLVRRFQVRCAGLQQDVQSLSGGNQQKIVVGRAAERAASLYLFDEPTRGVDAGAREEIYAPIYRLAQDGAAIIVATPDIQEALRLGDRVAVMRQGRLVFEEARGHVTEHAVLGAILGRSDTVSEPGPGPDAAHGSPERVTSE